MSASPWSSKACKVSIWSDLCLSLMAENTGIVEGSGRAELIHDGMSQGSGFPMGASTKLESDDKHATEGNATANKRKRTSIDGNFNGEGLELFFFECRKELNELYDFYKGVSSYKLHLEEGKQFSSLNFVVACLLEESSLPFSKVVGEIFDKLKAWEGNVGITLASVRSAVLFVGQRTMYGVMNEDVDVLEDDSMKCLWCWETRDSKFLPKNQRGFFNARRITRKKIHERISALSNIMVALSMPQTNKTYRSDIIKASQRLGRTLNVAEIRSFAEKLMQRNFTQMAEKEAKLKEKELTKTFENNKQNAEKERKIINREIQKEKLQAEKELRRVQEEATKEEKRLEKEEAELRKQIKKQEEQAKRDQWRQAKEAAELKKQLTLQKQAEIMKRFLNCNKVKISLLSTEEVPKTEEPCNSKGLVDTITSLMDQGLSQPESFPLDDLFRIHIVRWIKARSSNRFNRWGVRQKPRVSLFQELKLHGSFSDAEPLSRVAVPEKDLTNSKLNCSTEPNFSNHLSEHAVVASNCNARCGIVDNMQSCYHSIRKLLQFDKSNRPAYYGTWDRKSRVVGARHPFEKDPDLDYEFESDEEWEEEEPGESLSECEKDKEDDFLDNENLKDDDENESEDSFFVPDGYLSDNEGVQFDSTSDGIEHEPGSPTCFQIKNENEDSRAFFQKQKHLNTLTEQALKKCHPLIITNLMHEKSSSINLDDLVGTVKLEQICLQHLSIRVLSGGLAIDISSDQPSNKDHTFSLSQGKDTITSSATAAVVPHSDLPEFVKAIQSSPNSINKVVGSLQQRFSNISKSRIRNTIRDISEFVDNRWQVKKEVLDRLALPISPDKCINRPTGIAIFFSKRCLPPREESQETVKIQEP